MMIHVEISDFTRFPNAKAFTAYLGLTPSEHSSGEKIYRNGITKQGNTTVRSTLVECANALVKGTIGIKSKRVKARQKGQASKVIAYADKATERLQRKISSYDVSRQTQKCGNNGNSSRISVLYLGNRDEANRLEKLRREEWSEQ